MMKKRKNPLSHHSAPKNIGPRQSKNSPVEPSEERDKVQKEERFDSDAADNFNQQKGRREDSSVL